MVGETPFIGATLPNHEVKRRDIWDGKTIREALNDWEDGKLFIAIDLTFACSLRFGEICGITWDRVNCSNLLSKYTTGVNKNLPASENRPPEKKEKVAAIHEMMEHSNFMAP